MNSFSPPIVMSSLALESKSVNIHVVREDLLPGGTKQRAIVPFLDELGHDGFDEFVYASPFCGFAQVALAFGVQYLGKRATIFCERDPSVEFEKGGGLHELSLLAQTMGSRVIACDTLNAAAVSAEAYSCRDDRVMTLPLGFNHPRFLHFYATALEEQFEILCESLGGCPRAIWLPVGSGTLTRVFRSVLPASVRLNCVDVRVLASDDARINSLTYLENTTLYRSDSPFHEHSREAPPVPSNIYYDAKLWSFLEKHAQPDDVWWNVAR